MPQISKAQIEQATSFIRAKVDEGSAVAQLEKLKIINMLQSLLEQGEAQPVAWLNPDEPYSVITTSQKENNEFQYSDEFLAGHTQPLFAHPPAPKQEPMDLDLARAMCRSAGISLVSRDFIERFADFVSDWKKGDFTLPKYAELDMQSCFAAWQAFDPDLAAPKLVTVDDVTDEMLDAYFVEYASDGSTTWKDCPYLLVIAAKISCAKVINAYNGLTLEASK